jgi:hypothetical protein
LSVAGRLAEAIDYQYQLLRSYEILAENALYQGTTSVVPKAREKTYWALQAAEKLYSGNVLYQGTTLVVPRRQQDEVGL